MKQECFFDIKDGEIFFKSNGKKLSLENMRVFDAGTLAGGASASEASAGGDASASGAASSESEFAIFVRVPLESVALGDGNYDESLLAALRIFLKNLETSGSWAILAPVCAGASASEKSSANMNVSASAGVARATGENLSASECVSAISHTARRVKDCKSVVGVEIPPDFSEQDTAALIAELSRKHKHYIYFRNGRAQDVR